MKRAAVHVGSSFFMLERDEKKAVEALIMF